MRAKKKAEKKKRNHLEVGGKSQKHTFFFNPSLDLVGKGGGGGISV